MKVRVLRSLRSPTESGTRNPAPTPTALGNNLAGGPEASASSPDQLQKGIDGLERLGLDELRLQWRNRWGRLAPAHLPRALLFRLMAYRIQADTFGDLDRQSAAVLKKLMREDENARSAATVQPASASDALITSSKVRLAESPRILKPGAVMTREWQGRIERVMALEEGFAWNGKTYGSLSGVAFAITGVKWNGHRFFFNAKSRAGSDADGNHDGGEKSKAWPPIGNGKVRPRPLFTAEVAL